MKPIIVVSNRLPFVVTVDENGNPSRSTSAGGLVTALAPLVIKSNGFWVGWAGNDFTESMKIPESSDPTSISHGIKSSQIVPIFYSEDVYKSYYNGMCNASLWPLMHSLPTQALFKADYWNSYVEVNNSFANATLNSLRNLLESSSKTQVDNESDISRKPDHNSNSNGVPNHHANGNHVNHNSPSPSFKSETNLIWIHDYHLMMMPLMLKNLMDEASLTSKIAFFLHIPFPSWDIFRLNPWANELILGLLGCDLIAFHTNSYAINFLECCYYILGARIDKKEFIVEYGNKTTIVRALPIGIPYDWFEQMSKDSPKPFNFKEKVILGVDRLDYTKGIIQRVHGYERFLEKYPEYKEKVVFFQIAVPSRTDVEDYRNLKDELEREIGRISGRFGTSDWTPIKYLYKNISQYELTGYYRDAFIALITPVRDGMNLVCKEYVACQIDDPGVLIISPFTGAGETMNEALLVNPLEKDMLADAIKTALNMPYLERKLRMNALQNRERIFNLDTWLDSFFEACDLIENSNINLMQSLTIADFESWIGPLVKGYKISFILDYDGTLVPIAPHPDLAVMTDDVKELLEKLVSTPDVDVCILSGRSLENLKKMVKIKNITLSGSHGMETYLGKTNKEEYLEQAEVFKTKVSELAKDLNENVCSYGGWVEEKVYHVTFHWRDINENYRSTIIPKAKEIIQKHGFQVQNGHCAVEARPPIGWDKGRGTFSILEKLYGVTWADNVKAIFIGDDETDEDAIRALSGLGITFRVGKPNIKTAASHRLPNPASVKVFLEWAIGYMTNRNIIEASLERRNQGIIKKLKNMLSNKQ